MIYSLFHFPFGASLEELYFAAWLCPVSAVTWSKLIHSYSNWSAPALYICDIPWEVNSWWFTPKLKMEICWVRFGRCKRGSSMWSWISWALQVSCLCVQVKQRQDEEKRQLCTLRDQLRPVVHTEQVRDTDTYVGYFAVWTCKIMNVCLHVCVCACRTLCLSRCTICISCWETNSTGRRERDSSTRRVTGKHTT